MMGNGIMTVFCFYREKRRCEMKWVMVLIALFPLVVGAEEDNWVRSVRPKLLMLLGLVIEMALVLGLVYLMLLD